MRALPIGEQHIDEPAATQLMTASLAVVVTAEHQEQVGIGGQGGEDRSAAIAGPCGGRRPVGTGLEQGR